MLILRREEARFDLPNRREAYSITLSVPRCPGRTKLHYLINVSCSSVYLVFFVRFETFLPQLSNGAFHYKYIHSVISKTLRYKYILTHLLFPIVYVISENENYDGNTS